MNSIEYTRLEVFKRDKWICQVCGIHILRLFPQVAHRIPMSKVYLKKYGKEIIHHPLNLVSCCSLGCNSKVSINGKHLLIKNLVDEIKKMIDKNNKEII